MLAKGSPLYSGRSAECLPYFEHLGYTLPPFVNPAEFLIDLAAIDTRSSEAEESSAARVQGLIQAFEASPENEGLRSVEGKISTGPTESAEGKSWHHRAVLGHQIRVLTGRTFKTTYRDPMGIAGSMLEAISSKTIFRFMSSCSRLLFQSPDTLQEQFTHFTPQTGLITQTFIYR